MDNQVQHNSLKFNYLLMPKERPTIVPDDLPSTPQRENPTTRPTDPDQTPSEAPTMPPQDPEYNPRPKEFGDQMV